MNNIDLNIDNYDLNDLLQLFRMPHPFGPDDLRKAKKVVLQTHPDKSGLPKEYFLFFSKAFKLLHGLHSTRCNSSEYILDDATEEADTFKPLIDSAEFNGKFNQLFEQHRVKQCSDEGYGEWLQSTEGVSKVVVATPSAIHEHIQSQQRTLCVDETVRNIGDDITSNLDPDGPVNYGAPLFSKLLYDDVRRAHTETVVPVRQNERPAFSDEESLRKHRSQTVTAPLDQEDAARVLRDTRESEQQSDIQRAYRLAKQDEEVARANASWKSEFMKLTR